jgi:nucleotide-binding universal stress UspA family protein
LKRVLLILSPARVSQSCVDGAVDTAAEEGASLSVVFVLDSQISDGVRSRLLDAGFLGQRPSSGVLAAIREEQERQGRSELERVAGLARDRGVHADTRLVRGEFLKCSLEAARAESADAIFVARRERPAISRLVNGSLAEELKSSAPCPVVIRDDRKREG